MRRFIDKLLFGASPRYWDRRYARGKTSGEGSYGRLADFKARILNSFTAENGITSIIEFGCGDGAQLSHATYPQYIGIDVSPKAVSLCREKFAGDQTKRFLPLDEYAQEQAELALSLDVIYHLVEDDNFHRYMDTLFNAATKFTVIYSSNAEDLNSDDTAVHVRHRCFSAWVEKNRPDWQLVNTIPNEFPYKKDEAQTSFADFYIFARKTA